MGMFWYFS